VVLTLMWSVTLLQKTPRCRWISLSAATKTCQTPLSWKRPRCSRWRHRPGTVHSRKQVCPVGLWV